MKQHHLWIFLPLILLKCSSVKHRKSSVHHETWEGQKVLLVSLHNICEFWDWCKKRWTKNMKFCSANFYSLRVSRGKEWPRFLTKRINLEQKYKVNIDVRVLTTIKYNNFLISVHLQTYNLSLIHLLWLVRFMTDPCNSTTPVMLIAC